MLVQVVGSSGRRQWNRVTTATGYGSSSDKTLHFGMGGDVTTKSVEIQWPSGLRLKLMEVDGDRYLTVTEP